jgi:hypothetical protein
MADAKTTVACRPAGQDAPEGKAKSLSIKHYRKT